MQELQQATAPATTAAQVEQPSPQESKSLVLFFDTETTGIPEYSIPSEDPCQPHITELACQLYTDGGALIDSFCAMVRPDDWVIPDTVSALNGITTEIAAAQGIGEKDALLQFLNMHSFADIRVAHNCSFDDRILRIAIKRYLDDETAESFKGAPKACTALLSKPICQLPPTDKMKKTNFKNSFKTPNLSEALLHFTGETHQDGHRALSDVVACARVYFALQGVRMPDYPNDLDYLATGIDSEGGGHD